MAVENITRERGLRVQSPNQISYVLDASALVIFVRREYEWEIVESMLPQAVISTVNFTEVSQHLVDHGLPYQEVQEEMEGFGLRLLDFTSDQALVVAELYPLTQPEGLGLGDRACLGLARYLNLPAVTKETSWATLNLPVPVVRVGRSEEGARRGRRRGGRWEEKACACPHAI